MFAPRCPAAMDVCWRERPAFYRTDRHRVAACFLYRDSPALEAADVAGAFSTDTMPLAVMRHEPER